MTISARVAAQVIGYHGSHRMTIAETSRVEVGRDVGKVSKRQYQPYLEASWGLINHWYPALFSSELADGEVKGVTICGVPLLLRRAKGKVHALRDQCVHRGVKMSIKPMCLTEDTYTCWYHGFTYDLESGKLVTIIAAPDDEIVGTTGVQVFSVLEINGMVYVFVCEPGFEPVDISEDLPPRMPADYEHGVAYLTDPDTMVLGIKRRGNSNWRLAVENGFDPGHQMLHRDCEIVLAQDLALPLGINPTSPEALSVYEGDGPKGIMNEWQGGHYDLVMENEMLDIRARGTQGAVGLRTSMFLPGVLMVENWPRYGLAQYEWYVPLDDKEHEYWSVIAKTCKTDVERKQFQYDFDHLWRNAALVGFNAEDLFAREAMESFYAEDGPGWDDEQLCGMDAVIVAWRKLVSRYNRGIQVPQDHPSPKR